MEKTQAIVISLFITWIAMFSPATVWAQNNSYLQTYEINFAFLDNFIIEGQKSPNWTNGELTVFRNNCRDYILSADTSSNKITITIDNMNGAITINGRSYEELAKVFEFLPTGYSMTDKSKLYRQVHRSMDEAKRRGIFDQVFKEIKDDAEKK